MKYLTIFLLCWTLASSHKMLSISFLQWLIIIRYFIHQWLIHTIMYTQCTPHYIKLTKVRIQCVRAWYNILLNEIFNFAIHMYNYIEVLKKKLQKTSLINIPYICGIIFCTWESLKRIESHYYKLRRLIEYKLFVLTHIRIIVTYMH